MGVRQAAQSLVESHGPATVPGPATPETVPTTEEEETVERAQRTQERAGQSLVDQGIGVMVAVIVIGAVAIPVANTVIQDANVTGTAGTILGFVDLALALALFVAAISMVR
jgi:hypothetical protein